MRSIHRIAAGVLVPVLSISAFAQEQNRRQLEEVIVTAERQEASIQDTSISITAFTGETMEQFGIRNQSDLQNFVPATTIQPYDSAVRGVGRNFRNLGGDPGVATYMNGVYSEDLYTATIGSFWDIERIEVLRGPQGTLYGRNAVGGAMNFIYKGPEDQFNYSLKGIAGSYNTRDLYGFVTGPLIQDTLNARLTFSSRQHDGWVDELGPGPDLDSGDEQNVALQFEWFINDDMRVKLRSNQAKVDRVMGGADGGGLVVLKGSDLDGTRNLTLPTNAVRNVDPTQADPLENDWVFPGFPILTFTNPATGEDILAQYPVPGVHNSQDLVNQQRYSPLADDTRCVFNNRDDIDGDDLCALTNGLNNETFDQQGNQLEFTWDMSASATFKYILGYNDLLYERTTDDDNSFSLRDDRQFYVNHEAEYTSHEFQLFYDFSDSFTVTTGVFFYDATIEQRYDFYSSVDAVEIADPTFAQDSIIATLRASGAQLPPESALPSVPLTFLAALGADPVTIEAMEAANAGADFGDVSILSGAWLGATTLGSVVNGPANTTSDLHSTNRTDRNSFAVYSQGVWDINDRFTLTAGLRYARDELEGREALAQYTQTMSIADAFGLRLGELNVLRGALNPATLQPVYDQETATGSQALWLDGVPISFGLARKLEREDSDVTFRVNLDYEINDSQMIYGNVTSGYRSGGFNLAFFSQTPQYEPEELIAYELGYKAEFFSNTLQFNASAYLYDYDSIHTFTTEACNDPTSDDFNNSACAQGIAESTSSVIAAPSAEVNGFEFEVLWLATDSLTIGGNFSYTGSEYDESFIIVDGSDPRTPGSLYDGLEAEAQRGIDINGSQLQAVPETKGSAYASYMFPVGPGQLELMGTVSWIDDVYFAPYQSQLDLAPAYDRYDFRATWRSDDQNWIVSGFVNNAFNEIGIRQVERHGSADGFRRTAQVTEPRVYGLELTYQLR